MRKKNWIEFNNNIELNDLGDKISKNKSKKLKIYKEKKGKKGKTVTIISGFGSINTLQIGELLKKLKVYCGTGGSLKGQRILLQGDIQDKVKFFLRKEGYGI